MELDTKVWFFHIYTKEKSICFIIDETIIQIGNQHFWLWICIEPVHKSVLGIYISEERNMFVAENFIRSLLTNMVDIQFTLMVVHGIRKAALFTSKT